MYIFSKNNLKQHIIIRVFHYISLSYIFNFIHQHWYIIMHVIIIFLDFLYYCVLVCCYLVSGSQDSNKLELS